MKLGFSGLVAFLLFVPFSVFAETPEPIRPGVYEIDIETLMPHLEENLRYARTQERRCVGSGGEVSLFPILRHRSLAGCRLDRPRRRGGIVEFDLICSDPSVATGVARLSPRPSAVAGELHVKMGGKNMTFSQRIEARWRHPCE